MFKEYLEEKEEELNENMFDSVVVAAQVLGIGAAGILAAYGGSLIILAGAGGIAGIAKIWQKIKSKFASLKKPEDYIKRIKDDELVVHEIQKQKENKREFDEVLGEVYDLIGEQKFEEALEKYNNLELAFRRMPAVKQTIIVEITKAIGEPPIDLPSPGNKTYKTIKSFIGIGEAKAACEAVRYNIKKAMVPQDNEGIEGDK